MEFINFLQSYPHRVQHLVTSHWLVAGIVIVCVLILISLVTLVLEILEHYNFIKTEAVFLELTPPAFTNKTPLATEQLFAVLHHVRSTRTFLERLKRHKVVIALENTSARADGIRFIARVPTAQLSLFRQSIETYSPDVKVRKIKDYLPSTELKDESKFIRILSFKLQRHFAYSLNTPDSLQQHDPVGYITGSMTNLGNDELVSFQIVLSPIRPREARRVRNKLLAGEIPELSQNRAALPAKLVWFVMRLISKLGIGIIGLVSEMTRPSDSSPKYYPQYKQPKLPPPPSPAAQAIIDSLNDKLAQPLFAVSIRALVIADSKQEAQERANSIVASLAPFRVPGFQALVSRSPYPRFIKDKYRLWQFRHRSPSFRQSSSCILSSSELAGLYHFPHSDSAKTENVVKSLSKTLPATVALKSGQELDVLIGENRHHGSVTPIGLTEDERERHVYIVGGTGNGKTTMLLYSIMQDINNGKGLAVIDPHGDLAVSILEHIPKNRVKDVIYLNPRDIQHPIGINLLELPYGLDEDELLREKDLVTESVISVLRKIFSDDDTGGHRIEYVLRNAIHTAFTVDKANLFTIFRLLTDSKFRKATVRNLEDGDLKNFWRNELGKAGEFQRVKMSAGVTSKIGRFLFSAPAKRMLEQEKSSIDFDNLMQDKKILICNFSKGQVGEDTSSLFGTTILAKLQLAALRRALTEQTERTPFYIYVDEFQNFATMSFVQMLSEARKYKVFLTMAEQSTSQQDQQRLVDIILANVGTVVAFRTGSPADERVILPLFQPFVEQGEIQKLSAFDFYVRIAAIKVQEPVSGRTVVLEDAGSKAKAEKVIGYSQKKYGKPITATEKKEPKSQPEIKPSDNDQDEDTTNLGSELMPEIE